MAPFEIKTRCDEPQAPREHHVTALRVNRPASRGPANVSAAHPAAIAQHGNPHRARQRKPMHGPETDVPSLAAFAVENSVDDEEIHVVNLDGQDEQQGEHESRRSLPAEQQFSPRVKPTGEPTGPL